jgi:hypothetical protein
MTTKIIQPLGPLPIEFNEELHQYVWTPTGEVMGISVTGVLSVNKTAGQLANIEKHKPTWAPRGLHIHAALEHKLKELPFEVDPVYAEWVAPMLAHEFWADFEPLAIEYRLCDLKRGIGGSLDALGYDHFTEKMVLLDLKSQSSAKYGTYSTDAQMGGYLSMLLDRHQLEVDECLTVWARPGECLVGDPQDPQECLDAWEETYAKWLTLQEQI